MNIGVDKKKEINGSDKLNSSQDHKNYLMVYELHKSIMVTLLVILLTVCSVVLAIFAFRNPDPKSCYFFPGLDQPSRDPDLLLKTAEE